MTGQRTSEPSCQPEIVWNERRGKLLGKTADGFAVESWMGQSGRIVVRVDPPDRVGECFSTAMTKDHAREVASRLIASERDRIRKGTR
jgi:hypothetical protein